MTRKTGNRRSVESILVTSGNQALVAGSTALMNSTTGNVNVNTGQLAVIDVTGQGSHAINSTLTAGNTITIAPVIAIVQGTQNHNNIPLSNAYPLQRRPYEITDNIIGANCFAWTGHVYKGPLNSSVIIGAGVASASGQVNIADNSEYQINVSFRGRRAQEFYTSTHGAFGQRFSYTSPEYSTSGLVSPLDHLIKNLGYVVDRNSRQFYTSGVSFGANLPILAFALNSAGGTGVAITSAVGTNVPVIIDQTGVTRSVNIDQPMFDTFAAAVTSGDVLSTATIELIDLSVAGNTVDADQLYLMALDEQPAYIDRNAFLKFRLDVGIAGAFDPNTVLNAQVAPPFEGQGTSRQWLIYYRATAGQRQYSQYRGFEAVRIDYPTDIVDGATYNAYIIEWYESHQISLAGISPSPKKAIVLIPSGDSTTITSFKATMNPYLASAPASLPNV